MDDDLERDVDAAVEACEGDLRATIRALIVANSLLAAELAEAQSAISTGYRRRKN